MSSVQATPRGTGWRGQCQEIARQAQGPHLETQVGERLGGDLIPFRGQSGSHVFSLVPSVVLGAAPHPACKHGACSYSCPSSVAQRDARAQSQPFVWLLSDTPALAPCFCFWVKALWIPSASQGSSLSANTLGSFLPPPHTHPFTPALGTNLRTLWWQKWPKMSWVGRSTVGGLAPCLWSKNTQRTQCIYLVLELWESWFQIEQR